MKEETIKQLKAAEEQIENDGDYAIILAISAKGTGGHVFVNGNSGALSQFLAHISNQNKDFRITLEDALELAD